MEIYLKKHNLKRGLLIASVLLYLVLSSNLVLAQSEKESDTNRFNVVIILDASNSMNYTDPDGLRYEAIRQFSDLLAESGNYLGGVVFSNHVEAKQNPLPVRTQGDKENVIDILQSVVSDGVTETMGYTNIGEALQTSVDVLCSDGNSDLPSVIVFLSDGNTEMMMDEEQAESLGQKAEAIQKAREQSISIYSVCLNANNKADIGEMKQISDATGGAFREVTEAGDLQDVLHMFYSLIYGTSTIDLIDDVFPESGVLETEFNVPGIGVEEVNIIINGVAMKIDLLSPDGSDADMRQVYSKSYTLVKLKNVVPGKWTLVTKGVSGSSVRINMIYNTNLSVNMKVEPENLTAAPGETVHVEAKLKSGSMIADSLEQYTGYDAEFKILNAYQEEIENMAMDIGDSCFKADYAFGEGVYYVKVTVRGNYLERDSKIIGPLRISKNTDEKAAENTAPEPIDSPVKKKVYIWPFKGGKIEIDLGMLAKDAQGDHLVYKIVSSSFVEGTDYELSDDKLVVDHFSLPKGSFDIKVTDTGGLSCNVELIIVSYNVGIITCILLAAGAAAVFAAVGLNLWWWRKKPFRGTITVNGNARTPRRGRCRLSLFQLKNVGLNMTKCYFQATGENYIYLITDIPVRSSQLRETGKKTKIKTGMQVVLQADKEGVEKFTVKFESRMNSKGTGGRAPRRKSMRPVKR